MKQPGEDRTLIVVVRHGETEWNRVERFRGRIDVPLNEKGQRQALAVARRLSHWPIAAVYSSPLKRALQTAQPLAEVCQTTVSALEGIVDVDYGVWAGLSPEEAATRYPTMYRTWADHPHLVRFPQGESLEQVGDRALDALNEVSATHRGQTVALVSHVVVNRVLVLGAMGLGKASFWRIGQDNAAITILEAIGGQYRLQLLNDTCHLESMDRGAASSGKETGES
jgi:broad specificity phosphatase PhoE